MFKQFVYNLVKRFVYNYTIFFTIVCVFLFFTQAKVWHNLKISAID